MNDIDYVYEVYKQRSFSGAAKALSVSQPALSTAIKKLEESLGITIFDRSMSPITLTEEGKVYIDAVENIRKIERQTREILSDMSNMKTGRLTVSGENFVSSFIMPAVMKRYFKNYTGIEVELVENNSPDLRKLLLTENIDLLIAHDFDPKLYAACPLFEETLLLAVPEEFEVNGRLSDVRLNRAMVTKGKHLEKDCPSVKMGEFKELPFLLLKPGNDMHRRAGELFKEAGFQPKTVVRLDQLITSYNLALGGMGAAFVTDVLVSAVPGDGCFYYKIGSAHTKRTMSIGYKRNRCLSRACLAFIQTAKEVFDEQYPQK